MWYYDTNIGTFQIYPDSDRPGKYCLYIDTVHLGDYASPEAAADDVYKRSTGWDEWDLLSSESVPSNLSEWIEGK